VEEKDYDGVAELLAKPTFARLSTKKPKEMVDDQKKEQVKALRDEEKSAIKDISARYFQNTEEELLEAIRCCRKPMEMLVELTEEFIKRFAEQKREKNLLDFTDMEHFALEILMSKDGDTVRMSQAAKELSEKYDEVLVDEYQDSNLVQELLTTCVSGWVNERKNIFMVGDVKQSIYRFRLARPELFMEKYKSYSLKDSKEQRIDLHKNFRSRAEVLESVNYIFRQVMGEDLGGIPYDDAAALYPGAVFPEGQSQEFVKTEVLLVEKDGEELEDAKSLQNDRELEALAIAHKIRDMVGKEVILDKETGAYRPVEYGDIVILIRTSAGWAETFGEVLSSQGIPSYSASKTGYFSALEVATVLNYLRVCDNPLQDIPLAGVLRSPIVGCSTQELAIIRSAYPKGKLYDSVLACARICEGEEIPKEGIEREGIEKEGVEKTAASEAEEAALREKLQRFLQMLWDLRDMASYTPVHQMILLVLERTGYGNYARALPDGEQRSANLSMLVEKAMDYEKTSYRGLFNFVRYIEHLQKYEVDYGEVNLSGAGEGSVQIMTIHKSKGLEFPIVFTAGMGKQFNFQDMNARLLIHSDLGLGADAILPERRIIVSSLNKQVIRKVLLKESLGEELRILYVALTRAKEKLIMTGTIARLEKQMLSLARFQESEEERIPIGVRLKAKNYWGYVLPALARHGCMDELFREYGLTVNYKNTYRETDAEFLVKRITAKELVNDEIDYQTSAQINEEMLKNWDTQKIYDEEIRKELKERFEYVYPYGYLKEIPVKVTVSELKKKSRQEEYEVPETITIPQDSVPVIPRFIAQKEEEIKGAAKGTIYHRVMECLDYSKTATEEALLAQLAEMVERQKLGEEDAKCVRIVDIRNFLDSEIGKRMKKAAESGRLFREQPFMIGKKASEIESGWPKEETVLVQGIMDAYFMEEDGIVLVDYKTDRVRSVKTLIERYEGQLNDYAEALERMTGKKVKEKWIYSFELKKSCFVG
jgi:ATP-dependent helicase/nuclease subunit A